MVFFTPEGKVRNMCTQLTDELQAARDEVQRLSAELTAERARVERVRDAAFVGMRTAGEVVERVRLALADDAGE